MDNIEQKIKRNFFKNGLLLGGILLVLSIFSFYFITVINKSPIMYVAAPLICSILIPLIAVAVICFYGRKSIGGYWTFKQATTGIFIMFFTAYIVQIVGRDFIFAKLIEPNMIEKTEIAFLNASAIIKKQPGTDQKQMDKNIADIKKNFEDQKNVSIGSTIQTIMISILFIFVLALIFAALFKRNPPVYVDQIDEAP